MKKIALIFTLIACFGFISLTAQEPEMKTRKRTQEAEMRTRPVAEAPKAAPKTQKAATQFKADITGTVISLTKLAMDADPSVTKAEAEELVKKGQPLAFKSGNDIYLVYNAKNAFDSKNLAKYAEVKNLGIAGEIKFVNGFGVITAKQIQPVE